MLARTLTAEADRKAVTDIIEETFRPYGDLVQFVRRGGQVSEHSCEDCAYLEGAYLSLHGETKGYMTVPEAESEYDIFHPNCIHTLRITDGVLQQYRYLGVNIPTMDSLSSFVDAVLDSKVRPFKNEYVLGNITPKVQSFLKNQNINFKSVDIKATYNRIEHSIRDEKKPNQKVSIEQLKRIDKIIQKNNVYFDTTHKNLVYIDYLPKDEVKDDINIIKVPVNLKKDTIIGTVSKIPSVTITNSPKIYIKID